MIGCIEGEVKVVRLSICLIMAGGVGYKVAATKEGLRMNVNCNSSSSSSPSLRSAPKARLRY